jgi:hypothetical protein
MKRLLAKRSFLSLVVLPPPWKLLKNGESNILGPRYPMNEQG